MDNTSSFQSLFCPSRTPPVTTGQGHQAESRSFHQDTRKITSKTPRSVEVMGQCAVCKDVFTVTLFLLRGQLQVDLTPRLKYTRISGEDRLLHRPGVCNGKVSLYGSTEPLYASRPTRDHSYEDV